MSWFVKLRVDDDGNTEGVDAKPGALEAHMHWQVIWPRAVAKAWADESFHRELLKDAERAIETHFGYDMSNLKLIVVDAPADAQFDMANEGAGGTDPWDGLPKMELKMYLPPAPEAKLQAIAITAYEDTGRTYPFTCC